MKVKRYILRRTGEASCVGACSQAVRTHNVREQSITRVLWAPGRWSQGAGVRHHRAHSRGGRHRPPIRSLPRRLRAAARNAERQRPAEDASPTLQRRHAVSGRPSRSVVDRKSYWPSRTEDRRRARIPPSGWGIQVLVATNTVAADWIAGVPTADIEAR